ncbi:MAG: DMT family transporter [Lacisediminihabitans sp.]
MSGVRQAVPLAALHRLLDPVPSMRAALITLVILNLVWGGSLPATKVALDSFGPLTLTALRLVVAAALFLGLIGVRPIAQLGVRRALTAAGLGAIGFTGTQALQAIGATGTDAAVATVLAATAPLWIAVLAAIVLREHLTATVSTGLMVALIGVGVVSGLFVHWPPSGGAVAGLVVLASGITVALYTVLGKGELARMDPIVFTGVGVLGATVIAVPLGAWQAITAPRASTVVGWVMVGYLGAIVTFAGFIVWFWGLRTVPAAQAGALMFLQPVSGLALSALLLGNALPPVFLIGVVLVLGGTYLATGLVHARTPGAASHYR